MQTLASNPGSTSIVVSTTTEATYSVSGSATVTLNGAAVALKDLKAGDSVAFRSNRAGSLLIDLVANRHEIDLLTRLAVAERKASWLELCWRGAATKVFVFANWEVVDGLPLETPELRAEIEAVLASRKVSMTADREIQNIASHSLVFVDDGNGTRERMVTFPIDLDRVFSQPPKILRLGLATWSSYATGGEVGEVQRTAEAFAVTTDSLYFRQANGWAFDPLCGQKSWCEEAESGRRLKLAQAEYLKWAGQLEAAK